MQQQLKVNTIILTPALMMFYETNWVFVSEAPAQISAVIACFCPTVGGQMQLIVLC